MKRYSFGTFLVDESNREALQLCQDIANLQPVSPMPLVLVGDEGCGKTHLLYSIVNRVRAASGRTGLAYVTAHDFPDQVRALIDDPSPVERAPNAILLVDQLDQFVNLVAELEAVVRIFLENNQYVVLATKTHPGRLTRLTPRLRNLLASGRNVTIFSQDAQCQLELAKREARLEAEERLAQQQEEIVRLREALDLRLKAVGRRPEEATMARVESLEPAMPPQDEPDISSVDSMRRELEAERAAKIQSQTEIECLERECAELRGQLEAAHAERDRARDQADRMLERAEKLVALIEAGKQRFAESDQQQRRHIQELEALFAQGGAAAISAVDLNAAERTKPAAVAECEEIRREAAAQVARAQARAGELEERLTRLRAVLNLSRSTGTQVAAQLGGLHEQFAAAAETLAELAGELTSVAQAAEAGRLDPERAETWGRVEGLAELLGPTTDGLAIATVGAPEPAREATRFEAPSGNSGNVAALSVTEPAELPRDENLAAGPQSMRNLIESELEVDAIRASPDNDRLVLDDLHLFDAFSVPAAPVQPLPKLSSLQEDSDPSI
ncbi:MAG: hypothetical protein HY706_03260 [Candidatus Hydrogenedentes bacterium]|nr:hypothetical protein [Candidatus Hydrogenedentota bacterium]